jgi:hypothetical protein
MNTESQPPQLPSGWYPESTRTPPPSPSLLNHKEYISVGLLQKTLIDAIKAVQKSTDPIECSEPLTGPTENEKQRQRASKLEVKSILESSVVLSYSNKLKLNP